MTAGEFLDPHSNRNSLTVLGKVYHNGGAFLEFTCLQKVSHMANPSPQRKPHPEKIPIAKPLTPRQVNEGAPLATGPAKIPFPANRAPVSESTSSGPHIQISTAAKDPKKTESGEGKRHSRGSRNLAFLGMCGLIGLLAVTTGGAVLYVVSQQQPAKMVAKGTKEKRATNSGVNIDAEEPPGNSSQNKPAAKPSSPSAPAREKANKAAVPNTLPKPAANLTQPLEANATTPPAVTETPEGKPFLPAEPATSIPSAPPSASPSPPPTTTVAPPVAEEEKENNEILELFTSQKLLLRKEYPRLRKIFSDRFARTHMAEIRQGLGANADEALQWLDAHAEVKEEMYTAFDSQDNVPRAIALFNELRTKFPDKIVPYASLAIATSLVWDDPRGLQEYTNDAMWTKAKMPGGQLAAVENFQYLMEAEPWMQGRIRYVPWEFLVYVVNHRTPLDERQWVMQSYLDKRIMFGKCYSDVPYDYEMLDTNRERTKLMGKDYTLSNVRSFGGICEIQADFASRVGKSLGVPASHVAGKGAFGGVGHAWVMWVELKQATPTGIVFTLESHGRYFNDRYYVGNLKDPQTGQPITDRDMELRLQTVGMDVIGKRHMHLVMQSYPMIKEKSNLEAEQQLRLLGEIISLCPGNEEAWAAAARLARESAGEKKLAKQFNAVLERLFTTFARIPDFTWKVFDDLAAFSTEARQRNKLYERLVALYESAGRPDLAVEARLRLTDFLLEDKRENEAIQGLAITVKKFPDEGNLVPRLLDKIELICANQPNSGPQLVQFYTQFLPLIPQKRAGRPSDYCVDMYKRAIGLFERNGQPQLAQTLQVELANIQAVQPK
jgi:hypothetical protein